MSFMQWFTGKLSPAAVKTRQTDDARAVHLHSAFDSHPSKGLTPASLADILLAAEQGDMVAQAELFMDMEEKDAHIAAELSKRKMAVKKLDWSLEPPRDASAKEEENTERLEGLIRDELDMGAIRMDMLDAIGHAYACLELGWGRNRQGLWYPNQVEHRPPSWFTCPQAARNTLHLRQSSGLEGVPLQPFGWIPHIHKSRSGTLARAGLHRALAWPYLFKNYSARDLAEFLEIYGLPIRVGKYPQGADDKAKRDLLRTVLSIGHNAAGIIPESMQLELQSVMASGNADSFKVMIDWCEASQSKAILGGTLTSSTGANGNRSLGDVHNEVRLDIRDDDATQMDQSLSAYLVYPMAMLNGLFADNRCPSFVSDTQEPDDLALYADALPKLAAVGARIPARYVNLKLKIPEPEGDEPILGANPPSPPPAKGDEQSPAALAALAAQFAESRGLPFGSAQDKSGAEGDPTGIASQTEQLSREAGPSVKAMVDQIAALADRAESLDALRDQLLAGYGDLDSAKLTQIMALGFAAAELSGRFDAANEDL